MSDKTIKKYMIRCDMEGVGGIVSYEQAEPGKSEYETGKRYFMAELNAFIDGLNAGGADEIVIYDEHYYGRNIDMDDLPENVSVIAGKPPYRPEWAGGLDDTFAGLLLLGLHSKAGNPRGLLDHSYEHDILNMELNGRTVGEIGMEAAIAGDHGVPLLMVTGDSEAIVEAKDLIAKVETVVVKEALSKFGGRCYPTKVVAEMIKEKAEKVVRDMPDVQPYYVGEKAKLTLTLSEGMYLKKFVELFRGIMHNDNTVIIEGNTATEVWAKYWEMKLKVQEIL